MDKIKKAMQQAKQQRFRTVAVPDEPARTINIKRQDKGTANTTRQPIMSFKPDALLLEKNRIINEASRKEFVQPYKVLRTRLLQLMNEKNWSTIAVTSPTKDDGKTTVAINLAITIAHGLKSTAVLLDLDLITPSVHTYFDYLPDYGLEEYLENDAKLEQIFVTPGIDGLIIAPSIRPLHKSSEHLACDPCKDLISDVKKYDSEAVILVDLPPVLATDDAIAMMPSVDAVLLVIREGQTSKQDVTRALELLENTNIAGLILNDSAEPTELGYY